MTLKICTKGKLKTIKQNSSLSVIWKQPLMTIHTSAKNATDIWTEKLVIIFLFKIIFTTVFDLRHQTQAIKTQEMAKELRWSGRLLCAARSLSVLLLGPFTTAYHKTQYLYIFLTLKFHYIISHWQLVNLPWCLSLCSFTRQSKLDLCGSNDV